MTEKSKVEETNAVITALMTEHAKGRADLQLVMDSCMAARLTLERFDGCEGCASAAAFIQAVQYVLGSTSEGLKLLAESSHETSMAATMLHHPYTLPSKGDKTNEG